MTDFEHEHYKSASELMKLSRQAGHSIFNPVSKPGDSHYICPYGGTNDNKSNISAFILKKGV